MNLRKLRGVLYLLATAAIWGSAFAAQSVGMDYIGPFTYNAARSFLGGLVLLPFAIFAGKTQKNSEHSGLPKSTLKAGILIGLSLGVASLLQQSGIAALRASDATVNVGKAGFITALYIVLVPVLGLFFHSSCSRLVWFSVLISLIGIYLLSVPNGISSVEPADLLLLGCALAFAIQILLIDRFAGSENPIQMSCIQFFTAGVVSLIPSLLFETVTFSALAAAWFPIFYCGVFSSGLAYTLQILGQRDLEPTVASLLMSLESVFSLLAGWLFLRQRLSVREMFGCALVFIAILLAQLPERTTSDNTVSE